MTLLYALFFLALAEALPAEYKLLHGPDPKDPPWRPTSTNWTTA